MVMLTGCAWVGDDPTSPDDGSECGYKLDPVDCADAERAYNCMKSHIISHVNVYDWRCLACKYFHRFAGVGCLKCNSAQEVSDSG